MLLKITGFFFLEFLLHIFPAFSPGSLSLMVHMNWISTCHLLLGLYALCNAKIPRILPKLHTYVFSTIFSKANPNFLSAHHEGRSGSEGYTPLLHNLGRKLDWLVIFKPQPLYCRGQEPRTDVIDTQIRRLRLWKEEELFLFPGNWQVFSVIQPLMIIYPNSINKSVFEM